jgi:hypothetical protein
MNLYSTALGGRRHLPGQVDASAIRQPCLREVPRLPKRTPDKAYCYLTDAIGSVITQRPCLVTSFFGITALMLRLRRWPGAVLAVGALPSQG